MKQQEFILCAAIWINDEEHHEDQPEGIFEGFVICGHRHGDCYKTIKDLTGNVAAYLKKFKSHNEDRKYQGFVTSANRYVDRYEAWKIAGKNNQVVHGLVASEKGDDSILLSENLY